MGAAGGLTLSVKDRGLAPSYQKERAVGTAGGSWLFALQRRAGSAGNLASPPRFGCGIVIGYGGKETTLKELGEMLAHVVKHMATKDELAATNTELKSFRQEFNDFRDETRQNFREIHVELADIRGDSRRNEIARDQRHRIRKGN